MLRHEIKNKLKKDNDKSCNNKFGSEKCCSLNQEIDRQTDEIKKIKTKFKPKNLFLEQ